MLNVQLVKIWKGASGPVDVRIAITGLKLATIRAPVSPKKTPAEVNQILANMVPLHGMIPPTVAVSIRSAICMFAAKATARRIEPTMALVSRRHKRGSGRSLLSMNRFPGFIVLGLFVEFLITRDSE